MLEAWSPGLVGSWVATATTFLVAAGLLSTVRRLPHLLWFLAGYFYYLFSPVFFYWLYLATGYEVVPGWPNLFTGAAPINLSAIALYIVLLGAVYFIGDGVAARLRYPPYRPWFIRHRLTGWIAVGVAAVLVGVSALRAEKYLFEGYTEGYDPAVLGSLATSSILAFGVVLALWHREMMPTVRRVNIAALVVLAWAIVLLLSAGVRLYPLTIFIGLLISRQILTGRRYPLGWRGAVGLTAVVSLALAVGLWRMGADAHMQFNMLLFAEPLFTSISFASFWQQNHLPLVASGYESLSVAFNFLPRFLVPSKGDWVVTVRDLGYAYDSPFGADSVVVSLIGYFGLVGSLIVVAALGFFLRVLYERAVRAQSRHGLFYVAIVSALPFLFFRETFEISAKVVVTAGLLVPALMFCLDGFFTVIAAFVRQELRLGAGGSARSSMSRSGSQDV